MTRALARFGHSAFASLSVPNYRLYISGQALSLIGTWMQMTAQSWLVLELTNKSATKLGLIVAFQTIPVLLLGPYGGVIADRVNKRKMMIGLQCAMGVQALALGVLTATGVVRYWQIAVLAVVLGLNNAFENPSRQSFMLELVGPEHLRNAVSLNSTIVNLARIVGPAVAGVLIAVVGESVCFLINAASFIAVVSSLVRLDPTALSPAVPTPRARGQLREGLRYVAHTPNLIVPLAMMALVGCLAYEFQVSLPYLASKGLHVGSSGYGFMTSAMAVGAVVGGLMVASRGRTPVRPLVLSSAAFGFVLVLAALAPSLVTVLLALVLVGGISMPFMSMGNATMQLGSAPDMRGRVMSLWFVAFQGSTPIGGPVVGAVMGTLGARAGLGLGAVAALVAAAGGAIYLLVARGSSRQRPAVAVTAGSK